HNRITAFLEPRHSCQHRIVLTPFLIDGKSDHTGEGNQVTANGGVSDIMQATLTDDFGHQRAVNFVKVKPIEERLKLTETDGVSLLRRGRDLARQLLGPVAHDFSERPALVAIMRFSYCSVFALLVASFRNFRIVCP